MALTDLLIALSLMQKKDFEDLFNSEQTLWWFVGMERILKILLTTKVSVPANSAVLDAGCGTGGNLEAFQNWFKPKLITGLEYSTDALPFALKRNVKQLVQGSTTSLPFRDNTFDLVTSLDVIVQLPLASDPQTAINELVRTLKPGGTLIIRSAAYKWLRSNHDEALNSYHRFTVRDVVEMAKSANLEIVYTTYANFFLLPVAIVHRQIQKMFSSNAESDVKPPTGFFKPINSIFQLMLSFEGLLIRSGLSLPAGLSVICVCRKPLK